MGLFDVLPPAPAIRPSLNVGCLFDIPTGAYVTGKQGESILNGGMAALNSLVGPANAFKSEITNYLMFTILARYVDSKLVIYDTENSMNYGRLKRNAHLHEALKDLDINDKPDESSRVILTQAADIMGDVFFEHVKKEGQDRLKQKTKLIKTTPFLNRLQEHIKVIPPLCVCIDSLTEFKVSSVIESLVDKNAVGESGGNTQWIKGGAAKTQMITQLPNMGVGANMYFFQVAHVGPSVVLDPYAPKTTKLTHSKKGSDNKGVPPKFNFLNNNLLEIYDAKLMYNSSSDKTARYPKSQNDREDGTVDLMLVNLVNTRNKGGQSGIKFDIIISQSGGLLVSLTEFNYLVDQGYYGITGDIKNCSMDLYPEVKLSRTTVRSKIDEDPNLRKVIEITSQMRQMYMLWSDLPDIFICTPAELYKDITDLGYDWKTLLDTRSYWVFEEDKKNQKPFLSTMDLLRMRAGLYHPYWLPKIKK